MGWLLRRSDFETSRSRERRSPDRRARRFSPHAEAMEGRMLLSAIPPPPVGGGAWYWDGGGIVDGHKIQGAIYAKWVSLGKMPGCLGDPLTDELTTPDGVGRYQHFVQGGSIYWTPQTGAHEVHGAIRDKWASLGWERSSLGYPTTDEIVTPDGVGRVNYFQGGSIYWSPQTGAHVVSGAIRDEWAILGGYRGALGYPTTDQLTTPDGVGRFNHFQGGSIYWSPQTGAHEVHGAIRDNWASFGWERSPVGYPVSDEEPIQGNAIFQTITRSDVGVYQRFQYGYIYWTPYSAGARMHGPPTSTPPPTPAPPAPTPTAHTVTYTLALTWQAPWEGTMYATGSVLPIPGAKLKGVRNINTTWPSRSHLLFPNGHLLRSGDKASPSDLGLPESLDQGLFIRVVPSPIDQLQQVPVYVELEYEVRG